MPLVLLVLAGVSFPGLLEQARDVDVLLYMVAAARANAQDALPYASAWIEKGPLAMALFQAVDLVFGRYAFGALAFVWLAFAGAGTWIAGALARAAGATWADGWASLVFAVAVGSVGGTLNTEVPAMVLGGLAVLLWMRGGAAWHAGALAGAAFLCRQNAGVLLPVLLALDAVSHRSVPRLAAIAAAFAAPCAAVVAVYALAGQMAPFLFCFWEYNASIYVAATHVSAGRIARIPWDAFLAFVWPVRTAAALAAAAFLFSPVTRARLQLAAVAAGLLVAVVPGFRYFTHYAALALPFVAALAAPGIEALAARAGARVMLLFALIGFSLGLEVAPRGWLDTASRLSAWVARGGPRHLGDPLEWPGRDEGVVPVARYLRDASTPADRVFVWGMRPHVLAYADRVLATRFTTSTFLTGLVPWERVAPYEDTTRWIVPGAWDLFIEDLERERPRFIVDASQDHLFGDGAYAIDRFPRLKAILDRDYDRVFASGERDRYVVWKHR